MIFLCQKCTKMHYFTQNNSKIFWWGAQPFCQTPSLLGGGHPFPRPNTFLRGALTPRRWRPSLGAFGASILSPTTFFLIRPLVTSNTLLNYFSHGATMRSLSWRGYVEHGAMHMSPMCQLRSLDHTKSTVWHLQTPSTDGLFRSRISVSCVQ